MNNLPAGWVVSELNAFIDNIDAGLNVKCEERPPQLNERGLVKISAVTWGCFNELQSKTLPHEIVPDERNLIRAGDLLISRANTLELVGASVIVQDIKRKLYLSDKVLRLVVHQPSKRWINYALKTPKLRKAIEEASSGNQLSMRNLAQDKLRSLQIPVAPEKEQKTICDKLDKLTGRVTVCLERLTRVERVLTQFKKSVLNTVISGGLLDCEKTYQLVPLLSLVAEPLRNGKSVKDGEGLRVLRLSALKRGKIDVAECKQGNWDGIDGSRYIIQEGDFLVARGNGSKDLVGRGGMVEKCEGELAYPDTMIRVRPALDKVSPDYLRFVWDSNLVRKQIEASARTTAGIWKISQGDLENLQLPIPLLSEQSEIVRRVKTLFAFADRLEAKLQKAQAAAERLTPAILAKAFRGELVPQDPADEPAAELLKRLAEQRAAMPAAKKRRARPAQMNFDETLNDAA